MFYKLLGIVIWKAGKSLVRARYGSALAPKPLLAGGLVAVLIGAAGLAAAKRQEQPQ